MPQIIIHKCHSQKMYSYIESPISYATKKCKHKYTTLKKPIDYLTRNKLQIKVIQ